MIYVSHWFTGPKMWKHCSCCYLFPWLPSPLFVVCILQLDNLTDCFQRQQVSCRSYLSLVSSVHGYFLLSSCLGVAALLSFCALRRWSVWWEVKDSLCDSAWPGIPFHSDNLNTSAIYERPGSRRGSYGRARPMTNWPGYAQLYL